MRCSPEWAGVTRVGPVAGITRVVPIPAAEADILRVGGTLVGGTLVADTRVEAIPAVGILAAEWVDRWEESFWEGVDHMAVAAVAIPAAVGVDP